MISFIFTVEDSQPDCKARYQKLIYPRAGIPQIALQPLNRQALATKKEPTPVNSKHAGQCTCSSANTLTMNSHFTRTLVWRMTLYIFYLLRLATRVFVLKVPKADSDMMA
ncbi:uncharacterized protein P174DRAFT_60490 [Aspergillus novofumigatus IBT 16806]|uniref:Uncharacterized protein n=1 Tax=Aspergillus novofumigatus (strain IBT 16806) TaxID=1392255 RepID=A0A2I1BUB3_ASPN1|nr:uncharacterized protein P174DRAFT_60490 [Aspergillus novofumigatus IBT 16806]PKX88934.1 hypothetical protein P174DRAFT_60490 [Aspergillus novofumigatus IBT 16806]